MWVRNRDAGRSQIAGLLRAGSQSFAILMIALIPARTASARLDEIEIVAPSSPRGGWDQTAHAMKEVLEVTGAVGRVRVVNSPGAGGTIGLAQFVDARRGEGGVLLLGGDAMVGAIGAQHATVSLAEVTAVARLTGEHLVIAVPADSAFDSLDELLARMQTAPGSIAWAGSSMGGSDHALVGMLGQATGVKPLHVIYVPHTGGGKVAEALLADQVTVGVSGYGELAPHFESGQLRPLAVASAVRLPGVDVPTLRELGIDLIVTNWRGLFAPADLPDERRGELIAMVERMVHSDAWGYVLRKHRWTDFYLPGEEFARFVRAEEMRVGAIGSSPSLGSIEAWTPRLRVSLQRDLRAWAGSPARLAVLGGVCLLLVVIVYVRKSGARRESHLSHDLDVARHDVALRSQEIEEMHRGLGEEIDKQFGLWSLTAAEREIASLILKGLKHREIAEVRNTSERTVRQQALSVYKKAGLDGRTDLAAYFLEDLLPPTHTRSKVA